MWAAAAKGNQTSVTLTGCYKNSKNTSDSSVDSEEQLRMYQIFVKNFDSKCYAIDLDTPIEVSATTTALINPFSLTCFSIESYCGLLQDPHSKKEQCSTTGTATYIWWKTTSRWSQVIRIPSLGTKQHDFSCIASSWRF